FIEDVPKFMKMLRTQKSVVSGSVALYFFDPSRNCTPSDMDLYTPRRRKRRVMKFLKAEGYRVVPRTYPRHLEYGLSCGTSDVITVCDGRKCIDIVVALGRVSIAPIFRLYSSAVMNYISYPNLTARGRALYNPMVSVRGLPPPHLTRCYAKYASRGYDLAINP
ncbi:hypothetical protein BV22DRAFT_986993, partial [Leucogyrophana mollusca]